MNASLELAQLVVRERKSEIELRNGITIASQPCSQVTVRGYSVICAICDEQGFWEHEQNAANPEREVVAALRPAMATLTNTKLIKISTPNRKEGFLWEDFLKHESLPYPVWQASLERDESNDP